MPSFDDKNAEAMTEKAEAHQERYLAAMHAMQTGVAYLQSRGETETSPKHLRVGVNSSLVSQAALVQLLLDRGVFTLEEYFEAQADAAEREAESYRARVAQMSGANESGTKVTLR